jgi:hypothetical protein
LPAKDVTTL